MKRSLPPHAHSYTTSNSRTQQDGTLGHFPGQLTRVASGCWAGALVGAGLAGALVVGGVVAAGVAG